MVHGPQAACQGCPNKVSPNWWSRNWIIFTIKFNIDLCSWCFNTICWGSSGKYDVMLSYHFIHYIRIKSKIICMLCYCMNVPCFSEMYQERWIRADSRFGPSQWETALLCNDVSHWLSANWSNQGQFESHTNLTEHLPCQFQLRYRSHSPGMR